MTQQSWLGLGAVVLTTAACNAAAAPRSPQGWSPPSAGGSPRPGDALVTRTISWDVPVYRARYVREFLATDLKTFLPGTKKIPAVDHTEPLTEAQYPAVGSVRRVVLADGHTAEEEVLEQDIAHLRYLVCRYTTPAAAPVAYAVGEFRFDETSPASTHITWTYSFKLRDDAFPGSWGFLGRSFFRVGFVNSDYADFMDAGRTAMLAWAATLRTTE